MRGDTGKVGARTRESILRGDALPRGCAYAGRYEIEQRIGAGGTGDVYAAFDRRTRRRVALKVLHPPSGPAPSGETIERRLDLLLRLCHPHLLRILDVGEHRGARYIVTELLHGETVTQRIQRGGPLSASEAARVLLPVLAALGYLHGRGILHRDVKPQNIMLTTEGGVKLLDYGLARRLGVPESESETGALEGTAEYLSPEQVRGEVEDHRADLFACAAVLYEMLSGYPPFRKGTPDETAQARLVESPAFPRYARRRLPTELLAVALRGLRPEPERRYGSASAMRTALFASLDRAQPQALALPRAIGRVLRWCSGVARQPGRSRLAWAAPAVVLALGVGAWWGLAGSHPASVEVEGGSVVVRSLRGQALHRVTAAQPVRSATLVHRQAPLVLRVSGADGRDGLIVLDPTRDPDRDADGEATSQWWGPRGSCRAVRVQPRSAGHGARVWLGGRSSPENGKPMVAHLSLPELTVTGWTFLDGNGTVTGLRVAGEHVDVALSSGERRRLFGLAGAERMHSVADVSELSYTHRSAYPLPLAERVF